MAFQVNGYYNPAGMGPQVAAAPNGYPQPVVVPVNNYNANNVDAYIQQATQIAPVIGGVFPGKTAASQMGAGREMYSQAVKMKAVTRTGRANTLRATRLGDARSTMMGSITGAIKSSLIFNGIISLAINGYKVMTNKQTMADGGANFAGDMTSAAVGGAAAGVASGAATFILGGVLGAGLLTSLVGIAAGAAAYFVADNMLRQTQFYNKIKQTVHNALA